MDLSSALNYTPQAIEQLERLIPGLERNGFSGTARVHRELGQLLREAVKFNLPDHGDLVALESLDDAFSEFMKLPFDAVALETPWSKVVDPYTGDYQFAEVTASKRIAACWTTAMKSRFPNLCPRPENERGFYIASLFFDDSVKVWQLCPLCHFIPNNPEITRGAAPAITEAERLEREFLLKTGAIKLTNSSYECRNVLLLPEMFAILAKKIGSLEAAIARMSLDMRDETRTTFGFCLTINSSNVKRERIAPPEKLNKKRISNGKPPFFESWVLDLDKRTGDGSREGSTLEGTRTSPRLHLRRGHIRRLGPDRITFVRQATVGSLQQGQINKVYKVGAP